MDKNGLFPRDFFGWILLVFIIGSLTLTGYGHLRLIGVLLFGSYALYFLKEKRWVPNEIIVFVAWIVWSGATGYLVSIDKELFLQTFKVVFQIVLMSFVISSITANRMRLDTNFFGLVIGGIILFFSGVTSGELSAAISGGLQRGVRGLTANQNDYGYNLLICGAALLYFWGHNPSRKKRIIVISLLTIFLTGIIFSASRKSFLGFVLLVLLWLFMCYRKELIRRVYLFIPILLVAGGLYFATDYMLSNTYMGKRFKGETRSEAPKESIIEQENKRITLYKEGFELIRQSPLYGGGFGSFKASSQYKTESHSDYIEVLASTGIFGFLLYFSVYVLLWRRLSRIQKQISDPSILYNIGLIKAVIITILIEAFGRPIISSQVTWVILSSFIGYSWGLEKKLICLRIPRKYQ